MPCLAVRQFTNGTTIHKGRSGPQESEGEEQKRPHPDRGPDPRVQTSPGPPPSALEKAHPAGNSERRGGCSAEQPEPSDWQLPGGKEACLLIPRWWLRLPFLLPGGTVGLKWVSPSDVGHHARTCSWGRCAGRHPQPCQLRGFQLHGQEDLASPQEDPNDDTHERAGCCFVFFSKQIPLASVWDEFFVGNCFLEFSRMFMKLSEYLKRQFIQNNQMCVHRNL